MSQQSHSVAFFTIHSTWIYLTWIAHGLLWTISAPGHIPWSIGRNPDWNASICSVAGSAASKD